MENVRNHRDIKLATTNKKRSKLVSEPSYCTKKCFLENFLAIEMKKKNKSKNVLTYLIRIFNIRFKQNCNE